MRSSKRVFALVAKDFRIHGREIALTQAGIVGLIGLAMYLKPSDAGLNASLVFNFNFNFLLAGFWGEWLISREKTKGTFAWLRSCPVDDRELVLAKFAAVGICCVSLWVVSSAVLIGGYLIPARPAVWAVLQLALLAFGALSIAARWRFGQKLGQMLPYLLAGLVLGALIVASRSGHPLPVDPQRLLRFPAGQALLGAALMGTYVALFSVTYRWVRRSDTAKLLE